SRLLLIGGIVTPDPLHLDPYAQKGSHDQQGDHERPAAKAEERHAATPGPISTFQHATVARRGRATSGVEPTRHDRGARRRRSAPFTSVGTAESTRPLPCGGEPGSQTGRRRGSD